MNLSEYLDKRFENFSELVLIAPEPEDMLSDLTVPEIYLALMQEYGDKDPRSVLKKINPQKIIDELGKRREAGFETLDLFVNRVLRKFHAQGFEKRHFSDYHVYRKHMLNIFKTWLDHDRKRRDEVSRWKQKLLKDEFVHGPTHCPDSTYIDTDLYVPEKNCCARLVSSGFKTPDNTINKIARLVVYGTREARDRGLKAQEYDRHVFKRACIQDVMRSRIVADDEKEKHVIGMVRGLKEEGYEVLDMQSRDAPESPIKYCRMVLEAPPKDSRMRERKDRVFSLQIINPDNYYRDMFDDSSLVHPVYCQRRRWEPFRGDNAGMEMYNGLVAKAHYTLHS